MTAAASWTVCSTTAHTLVIQGESYRLKQKNRSGFLESTKT
jgi:hypothetical protein